jgi:N-carbamoyl-L-amino-acid hydrolase
MPHALRIDAGRLNTSLEDLARIGARAGGGVTRLAFTEVQKAGRDHVEAWMRALGLDVRIDGIGNMIGVRAGREAGPVVLTGSHTDTVGTGGRYDGALGVLAGLEAIAVLNDAGLTTRRPLAVVDFVNEEGVRYMPDMMGSQVFEGRLDLADARAAAGTDGTTLGDELDRLGFGGPDDFGGLDVHGFVELHIEQGPVLESEGLTIGVVDGVQGITWLAFRLRGQANHAGTTPMEMRKDAGFVAASIACHARRLAREIGGAQRTTVGSIAFGPNLVNVIPEEAYLTVDLRNPDAAHLAEAEARLRRYARDCADDEGVTLEVEDLTRVPPVAFDPSVVAEVERAAARLGYPARRLPSGAGHDAQILAARWPTAMIFIPSVGGISHNVREYSRPEDVAAGANVLLQTLLALAER